MLAWSVPYRIHMGILNIIKNHGFRRMVCVRYTDIIQSRGKIMIRGSRRYETW